MAWSESERKKRSNKCDNPKGFTMKQFCKNKKTKSKKGQRNNEGKVSSPKRSKTPGPGKKEYLYNKNNPKKSFDVYIDKNPKDTIPIKYTTVDDVKHTIGKLEQLYKSGKYPHKRIWQVGMIMKVRLDAIKKHNPHVKGINGRVALAQKYFKFLGKRTKTEKTERKKMVFKIDA